MEVGRSPKTSLLNVLTTTIILYHTTPYLPVRSLLALAATSKPLRDLIYKTPGVWRYLDLSDLKQLNTWYHGLDTGGVYWRRDRQTSRDMPEDDFYAAPLRHIFGNFFRREVFRDVQTLILDGLSVPVNVISEIILDEKRFHVRVLSIRDSKDVNDRKLLQLLRYAVRRSRPDGSPRLKALYTFSRRDAAALPSTRTISRPRPPEQENQGITSLLGAQIGAEWNEKSREALSIALEDTGHVWYQSSGLVPLSLQGRSIGTDEELEQTLELCQGIIAFDAILCRGPRHSQQKTSTSPGGSHDGLPRSVAHVALGPRGCAICHSAPEGPAIWSESPSHHLPLLVPPPLHSSTVAAAQRPPSSPNGKVPPLFARCLTCLRDRWCERCNKWWCEDCYPNAELNTRTHLQKIEQEEEVLTSTSKLSLSGEGGGQPSIKVHLGLCVQHCLVGEMMAGAGEGGMWG